MINDLQAASETSCNEIGIVFRAVPIDGNFHQLDVVDKLPRNGAGRIRMFPDGEGGQVWNHVTGETRLFWAKNDKSLTPAEMEKRNCRIKVEREESERKLAKAREKAAELAAKVWQSAKPPVDNLYLTPKQVMPTITIRELPLDAMVQLIAYHPQAKGQPFTGSMILVIPIYNEHMITSIEMIDESGRKAGLKDGLKQGGYWATTTLPDGDGAGFSFGIGEGVATMLSYHMATGNIGIAALSCGNLKAVAELFRRRYPLAQIIIISDRGNGEHKAVEAASAINSMIVIPVLPEGSTGSDINDVHVEMGLDEVQRQIESASIITPASVTTNHLQVNIETEKLNVWPEPLPFERKLNPVPYPLDALPPLIHDAVVEVQAFVQAPVSLIACTALAALSVTVQAHVDVERAQKLTGPCGLFLLTIADSGERKTTCDSFFTKVIKDYEAQQEQEAKPLIKKYEAVLAGWTSKSNGIKDKIRQLAKSGEGTLDAENELIALEHEKPEPPRYPVLTYADSTPESLKWDLAKKWPSAGVISSEGGVVFGAHSMGADSVTRNLATLNQLWDGKDIQTGRRSSDSFTVRGARLTMAVQIQEAALRDFFSKTGALARGTGFLARFLVAWPESTQGYRFYSEAPEHWPNLAAFNRRIDSLLEQPAPIDDDGCLHPALLPMAPDAKAAWIVFYDAIESELVSGGELYDVRDVASKTADNAARIAALFQVFLHGGGAIGLDVFVSASRIAAWHLNESRRFFGELTLPTEIADAQRLDKWLTDFCMRGKTGTVPTKKVQQFGPHGLRTKAAIESALEELESLGRARLVKDGKCRSIAINPRLLEGE